MYRFRVGPQDVNGKTVIWDAIVIFRMQNGKIRDMVTALEQWVELGKAPDQIIASHSANGNVDRTRPLCPFPQVAAYKGTGSTDEAANFVCKAP